MLKEKNNFVLQGEKKDPGAEAPGLARRFRGEAFSVVTKVVAKRES